MDSLHVKTPAKALYPLTAREACVAPGQIVEKDEGLYVFTMKDGRDILIKAPQRGRVCPPIFPSGTTLDRPMPFLTLEPLPETAPTPREQARAPEPTPETQPPEKCSGGRWLAAAVSLLLPALAAFAAFLLCELAFPDFFEDAIAARWGLILAAFLAGVWFSTGIAARLHPSPNRLATAGTIAAGLLAVIFLLPAALISETLEDNGIHVDLSPAHLFNPSAYGVVLEDPARHSNGVTPTPSARQAQEFASWLND